jgi:hypothetical protein
MRQLKRVIGERAFNLHSRMSLEKTNVEYYGTPNMRREN